MTNHFVSQMMADDHRGWAWTRALLGLQAKEIHVCGDSSVLRMLKRIANTCGDELEVRNYERWKPLSVEEASFGGSWEQVDEGDCVVAFSRKEIFQIKVGLQTGFWLNIGPWVKERSCFVGVTKEV